MILSLFIDMNIFLYVENEYPCLFKVKTNLHVISEVQPNFILNLEKIIYPFSKSYLSRNAQYARSKKELMFLQ